MATEMFGKQRSRFSKITNIDKVRHRKFCNQTDGRQKYWNLKSSGIGVAGF